MPPRPSIALDFSRHDLRAVAAVADGARLDVHRVLDERVPESVDVTDTEAHGTWVAERLRDAGFAKGEATVAISREHVAIKRLTLPTTDQRELPAMAALAVRGELPFDVAEAVIDFVLLEQSETSTTLLIVAAPRPVVESIDAVVRRAGMKIERLSLRAMGAAALMKEQPAAGAVLAVDISADRVEFSIIVDGRVQFTRAGILPHDATVNERVEAVITETRRTWMSYRITADSDNVSRATVLGESAVAEPVARSIAEILKVETATMRSHPRIDARETLDGAWPLAGLLLAPAIDLPMIDLTNPRRTPDTAARRRQLILGAVGILVILIGAMITVARPQLAAMEKRINDLRETRRQLQPVYARYGRDLYKLRHLREWETADAAWLDHLQRVLTHAPATDKLVLDEWTGSIGFAGVKYDRNTDEFNAPKQIRILLEGEAIDRATADAFRGALVSTDTYRISTAGPDAPGGRRLPYGFSYTLRTTDSVPVLPAAEQETPQEIPGDSATAARTRTVRRDTP